LCAEINNSCNYTATARTISWRIDLTSTKKNLSLPYITQNFWHDLTFKGMYLTTKIKVTDCGIGGRDFVPGVAWILSTSTCSDRGTARDPTRLWSDGIGIQSTKA
jgi:hypothetical protein